MSENLDPIDVAFVIEQALGHVTYGKNLRRHMAHEPTVAAHWVLPTWEGERWFDRLPLYGSNWTVRAGIQARRGLRALRQKVDPDVLFYHTQVPAMLTPDWVARYPTVISLDATPRQYDFLGAFYDHEQGPAWAERAKWQLHKRTLGAARRLVAWSAWARDGLVSEYEIAASDVTVIPPGVDAAWWRRPTPRTLAEAEERPLRVLFVGGDLERKGGQLLLQAIRTLRAEGLPLSLNLVTRADVADAPGVTVYNDMQPNTERLRSLFFESDIFCLPTYGDCLPMVLSEAGAAGLPLVATDVAAIPEIVRHGETGLLVPVDDARALAAALRRLAEAPSERLALGKAARQLVGTAYDGQTNANRLVALLHEVAEQEEAEVFPIAEPSDVASAPPAALLSVSGTIPAALDEEIRAGRRPLADYVALAATIPADLIDYPMARALAGTWGRVLETLGGANLLLAWACFHLRHRYDLLFSDGEQVGLPLALLLKYVAPLLDRARDRPRHMMIGHLLSVPKKARLLDLLRLHSHIDTFIVYSRWQKQYVEAQWQIPGERVVFTPFMVDAHFFAAEAIDDSEPPPPAVPPRERPLLSSAGLEYRDYPTLIAAVRGLDVDLIIAAASPWSKRDDSTGEAAIPANVHVARFSQYDLRRVYAESDFVVMPLYDVPFQAGVTAILEAMAMGKAVICSATRGQTDIIVHGETGLYVPPGDAPALREAICRLLADPELAAAMGRAGRARIEDSIALPHYAQRLAQLAALQMRAAGRSAGGEGVADA